MIFLSGIALILPKRAHDKSKQIWVFLDTTNQKQYSHMLLFLDRSLHLKIQRDWCIFQDILTIKEFCNIIGQEYFSLYLVNQTFSRYCVGEEKQRIVIPFNLGYFKEDVMTKTFVKSQKIPSSWAL